jgi:potassium efflux system protein
MKNMPISLINKWFIAILIVSFSCFSKLASAQVPNLARLLGGPSTTAAPASAPEVNAEDWAARLKSLQQSYTQWQQAADPSTEELRRVTERLLEQLSSFVQSRQAETNPKDEAADLPTLPTEGKTAPFSMLDVDALRDMRDHGAAQQRMLGNALALQEDEVVAGLAQRKRTSEALRLRQEQLERAQSDTDKAGQSVAFELARVQSLSAELQVALAVQARANARTRRDAWTKPLARMDQEIERVRPHQQLSEQDMAHIRQQSEAAANRWESRRLQTAQMLARLESGKLQQAYALQTQAYQTRVRALLELRALARGQMQVWESRQRALQAGPNASLARQAVQTIEPALTQIAQRLLAVEEQRDLLMAEQRAYLARQTNASSNDTEPGDIKTLADVRELADLYEHMRQDLVRVRVQLSRSLEDLNLSPRELGLGEWFGHVWAVLLQTLQRVWQFELFSATETSQVNGQTVTVDYGVTIGKSVGVLVLFVLGYALATRLASVLTRVLVQRGGVSEALALVLQRWLMSLLVIVVLLVVLRMARVPLTVFAFLGGALAIGFGFGAQNVIKNLISGVIILFERKVRVGDVVTIGGISGTVTAVDLRATTVSGFDGVISIVPNSFLLEQQVSSWSYGNPPLRRSITVGIAYGSDTALVAQQLLFCAQSHPLVLPEPAAVVLLEEFGTDSLLFRLNYWIAHSRPRSGPEIDSDLRLAIEAALAAAGLGIPFAQRDVHLHTTNPIVVQCESRAQ